MPTNTRTPHVFVHTDGANLFHRQINMTNPALGIDNAIGMALHMILYSMKKEYTKWGGTHLVFYHEGRSWRKNIFPEYKANRKVTFAQQTPQEQEDHGILLEAFDDFTTYLYNKTNVTVLRNPNAEADDMISVFIEAHPDDKHILISSDSDFFQLLRHPNVMLYDPVKDIQIRQDGVFDDDGNRLEFEVKSDAKIKVGKKNKDFVCEEKWYEWALFLKCIRGDKVDNIFSAYPGARETGTKNKVGIREAYLDVGKGYNWNNFMQQKWTDHNDIERQVKERYEFNKSLIDLNEIPDSVKAECLAIIAEETNRVPVPAVDVGHAFLKFCGKWDLKRIQDSVTAFMPMMKSKYKVE
jgi:5'-3' exonuclease